MSTTNTNEQLSISGRVIQLLPLQQGTSKAGNAWRKQDVVIETFGQYPRKVCFNLFGDNIEKFPLQVGQEVSASIDIESREFNGRWYTDVRAWNVIYTDGSGLAQSAQISPAAATTTAPAPKMKAAAPAPASSPQVADDLPF